MGKVFLIIFSSNLALTLIRRTAIAANITIKVFVNEDLHIEMQAYQFHNAQCECEMQNSIHMAFFENLHKWKLDGKDIMSI